MFSIYSILAQATPPPEAVQQRFVPGWAILLIAVTIFGLPFLFGSLISSRLKMKEYSLKISLVLLALCLGISPIAAQYVVGYAEQVAYERSMEDFEKKEKNYGGVKKGLDDLKSKNPNLQIVRRAIRKSQQQETEN